MKHPLFKIKHKDQAILTDFTKNILLPTYSVNKVPIYVTWEDQQFKEHRRLVRNKITGSFQMYFDTVEEFNQFIQIMDQNKNVEGYINAQLYCVNTASFVTGCEISIDWEPSDIIPIIGVENYDGIDIQITNSRNESW